MKDNQKVFIRGVKGRGEEVIKMLTNLGATEDAGFEGDDPEWLYFINHMGVVDFTSTDTEIGQIIMGNYTELHLPEKWKDGDVLVDKHNGQVMALYEFITDKDADLFNAYFRIDDNMIFSHSLEVRNRFRLATDQEIERFYELLHKHHKDWDAEKKEVVDWKWKPKEGDDYWTVIVGIANMLKLTWFGTRADEARYKLGNCFKTREEAEAMSEKVKNLFLQNYEKTKENS